MTRPKRGWTVNSEPRADGWLSIVEVSDSHCVLSNGDMLRIRWEKLRMRCECACRARAPVWIRTWPIKDMHELIELRVWSDPGVVTEPETLPIEGPF